MSNDFWDKRIERDRAAGKLPPSAPPRTAQNAPWWASSTPQAPQPRSEVPTPQDGAQDRDFSKAQHIKGEGRCPECDRDGYFRSTSNSARRCYFCGYVEGRDIHSIGTLGAPTVSGPAQRARQTDSGGRVVNNYHSITTAEQAVDRIA